MSGPGDRARSGVELGRVVGGRYRIVLLLGAGGMGVVVRAHDLRLGRDVALKLLHADALGDSQGRARLLREAHAMAAFTHPNVVHVYDAGETDDGGAFVAMELVEGETVRSKLGSPWPTADRLRALGDAARALGAAHRAGLVHRDIKPDNLMVRTDGRVVLLDFGIARVARGESGPHALGTLTAPDTTIGTLAYMSPEQAQAAPLDGRSDQFSFGVTAFEVLTGEYPWPRETPGAQLAALLTKPAPAVSSRARVPAALDAVLAKAMEKEPGERYPSMEAFADALEAAAAGGLAAGGAASDAYARTQAVPTPGVSAAALARTEAAPTPAPAGGRPTSRRWLARAAIALVAIGLVAAGWNAARRSAPVAASASAAPSASAPSSSAIDELAAGTTNPDARAAFVAGQQALHDGDEFGAQQSFIKARELDPAYAAAHLWDAEVTADVDLVAARAAFEKAVARRASLGAANLALLAAVRPCIQTEPPDMAACSASLDAAAHAASGSSYLWYRLALAHYTTAGDPVAAVAEMDRALAIDPTFVMPIAMKGQALAYMGRFDDALATLDRCIGLAPTAQACFTYRMMIHDQRGDCSAIESDARKWRAVASDQPEVYLRLAQAALARGAPSEAVDDLMAQSVARLPRSVPWLGPLYSAVSAVVAGDFDAARRHLGAAEPLVSPLPDQESHYALRSMQASIALESGASAEAARLAEDTLRRKDSWLPNSRNEDYAIGADGEPPLVDLLRECGALSHRVAAERRDAWVGAWRKRAAPFYHPYLWVKAYAALVDDEDEAREALATLPEGGIPALRPNSFPVPDAGIGKMYLLAGRATEAVPYLRRAAQGCWGIQDPFTSVGAAIPLGEALEKTGDHEGACRAWQSVVDRWGHAKPRSVTAEKARALAKAAHCRTP